MSEKLEIKQFNLWQKLNDKRVPTDFELEITARCNLNCRHCYINLPVGDREARDRELTKDELINIARQAVDLGVLFCLITGGEPLLRQDFEEIYLELKHLGLIVSVFTNATQIEDNHIKLFKMYPPRDIEITAYGVTKKTYESVTRRSGSFEKFKRGLEKLESSGVRVRMKTMALSSNFHEQEALASFCKGKTKDYYRFDPHLHLRFDGDPDRNAEIVSERLTPEQIVTLEEADNERYISLQKNCDNLIRDDFAIHNCDHLFHCGAGNGSFNVSYDGHFRLCSSLCAEGTTYDLKKGTLTEAWNDFVPKVRQMRSQRQEFLETCRKCALVNLCLWCPAHAHLETGQLDGSTPYFCEVAHKRAESIKKQVNKEK